jgi:hypothetical protein
MTPPTLPTIDLYLLTAALIEFAIMYAAAIDNRPELAKRNGQVLPPTTNYMVGVGIIVLVFIPLELIRASGLPNWSVPVFQFLFDLIVIIAAGGAAAFAHRKRHGEPVANPPLSPEERAAYDKIIRESQEVVARVTTTEGSTV